MPEKALPSKTKAVQCGWKIFMDDMRVMRASESCFYFPWMLFYHWRFYPSYYVCLEPCSVKFMFFEIDNCFISVKEPVILN